MQEIGETFVGMTAPQMPDIDKLPAFQVWFPRDPRAPTAKKMSPKRDESGNMRNVWKEEQEKNSIFMSTWKKKP